MLDFSSFDSPVTREDIEKYKIWAREPIGPLVPHWMRNLFALLVVLYFIGTMYALGVAAYHKSVNETVGWYSFMMAVFSSAFGPALGSTIAISGIALLLVIPVFKANEARDKYRAKLYRFARLNYIDIEFDRIRPEYQSLLFTSTSVRKVIARLLWPDGLHVGNVMLLRGYGTYSSSEIWRYASVELPRPMPHMLLDARSNDILRKKSSLPEGYHAKELRLEGGFEKYFRLFAPEGYERDALYIFTPDVMVALMEHGGAYDMEIIDNRMYFYTNKELKIENQAEVSEFLVMIDVIRKEVAHQSGRYSDARSSAPRGSEVALEGRRMRLKFRVLGAAIFTLVMAAVAVFMIMVMIMGMMEAFGR